MWQCAAVCGRDGMKLPLKSGRYAALKRLLVFVCTIADEREQWSQLAGVPAAIEGHSPAAKTPLALNFDVDLLAATHVRLRALPTEEGRAGVWGLRMGDNTEGAVTVSRTTSHMVTLIGDVCGPRSQQPVLRQTSKLECVLLLLRPPLPSPAPRPPARALLSPTRFAGSRAGGRSKSSEHSLKTTAALRWSGNTRCSSTRHAATRVYARRRQWWPI